MIGQAILCAIGTFLKTFSIFISDIFYIGTFVVINNVIRETFRHVILSSIKIPLNTDATTTFKLLHISWRDGFI